MSRVVSVRLDDSDPDSDEGRALALLDQAEASGWTLRKAIVWAVLQAGGYPPLTDPDEATAELRATLAEARQLVDALHQVGQVSSAPAPAESDARPLSSELTASIRRAAKTSRRLE